MLVQLGLSRTCSETILLVFPRGGSNFVNLSWLSSWIEGFISKSLAEKKLKESQRCRSAMYLLRFSDSYITDSQGLKSVFGFVTAAVLMIKKVKGNVK